MPEIKRTVDTCIVIVDVNLDDALLTIGCNLGCDSSPEVTGIVGMVFSTRRRDKPGALHSNSLYMGLNLQEPVGLMMI